MTTIKHSLPLAVALWLIPSATWAFYETETLDARGSLRVTASSARNPDNRWLFPHEYSGSAGGEGRLLVKWEASKLRFDFNGYAIASHVSVASALAAPRGVDDTERSPALFTRWMDDERSIGVAAVDRMSMAYSADWLDVIIGRQPVSLATCFFFTPNDFFAPFAAQTFYRVYKPGVDAARVEARLGGLAQLSLIGALGYRRDADGGWSSDVEWERAAALARITMVAHGFEIGALAGRAQGEEKYGASLQGELFMGVGLRAEGNLARGAGDRVEAAVELEKRYPSSLNARLAYFWHGAGEDDPARYLSVLTGVGGYLGKSYSALGLGYEFGPLTAGDAALIRNMSDGSMLLALNLIRSLSDESELALSLSVPLGREPRGFTLESEYGAAPLTAAVEMRGYF